MPKLIGLGCKWTHKITQSSLIFLFLSTPLGLHNQFNNQGFIQVVFRKDLFNKLSTPWCQNIMKLLSFVLILGNQNKSFFLIAQLLCFLNLLTHRIRLKWPKLQTPISIFYRKKCLPKQPNLSHKLVILL